eukprot:Skav216588  [mRNA]  locus=scaffold3151:211343:215359:+ [translate_table: standard]
MAKDAKDESTYRSGIRLLSFGFLGVFGGFQASQGLQSSLNAELGELNLACLYGTFSILCLVAPPVLGRLERIMTIPWLLLICSSAYAAMALSNLIPMPAEPSPMWAVPITFNVLVGVSAPLLWTAQNTYVGRSAVAAATFLQEPTEKWTTCYTSLFFSIYQFAGMFGNILSSVILLSLGELAWSRSVLFVTLGIVTFSGACLFIPMPAVEAAATGRKFAGLLDTGRLALTEAKVGLMVPLMLTNGMTIAFFLGDFMTDVTCPVAGSGFTGFAIATFFGVNALSCAMWGRLINKQYLSRRVVFFLAAVLVGLFLALKMVWKVPRNYQLEGDNWELVTPPKVSDIAVLFAMAALFGVGDSFFESGPPMILQSFYAGTNSHMPAMANYKLWQSLGQAIQFFIAIPLKPFPELRGLQTISGLATG